MAAAANAAARIRTHLRRREFTLGLTPNFTWHTESMVQRQPRSLAATLSRRSTPRPKAIDPYIGQLSWNRSSALRAYELS
jgi:hypothetical protein